MKVSVVIPAYNEEAFIGKCLDSLMKQEVPPDEIIVVNNNSTDRTAEIIKQYPVKMLTEYKKGNIAARNRGFNEAKYELIARTDADTILPPDWIKRIKEHFSKDKKLIGLSGPGEFYDVPEPVIATKWSATQVFKSYTRIMKQVLNHHCMFGPNMAFRKSAWEKVKNEVCLDDKEIHEDIDIAVHLATIGKIKFDQTLVVQSSFRRWKKLQPYFEYPYRGVKSVRRHKQFTLHKRSKHLVKRLISHVLTDL